MIINDLKIRIKDLERVGDRTAARLEIAREIESEKFTKLYQHLIEIREIYGCIPGALCAYQIQLESELAKVVEEKGISYQSLFPSK